MAESEKKRPFKQPLRRSKNSSVKALLWKLGQKFIPECRSNSDRFSFAGYRTWYRRRSARKNHRNLWTKKALVKLPLPTHTSLPKRRRWAARAVFIDVEHAPTQFMQALGVDIDSPAGFPARYRWTGTGNLWKHWFVPVLSRCSRCRLSLQRWPPRQKSKARWVIPLLACRQDWCLWSPGKLTGAISKSNAVCIFINQLREKIRCYVR